MAAILKALKIAGGTVLVTTAEHNVNVYKSARNIDGVEVAPATGLNALNLLQPATSADDQGGARCGSLACEEVGLVAAAVAAGMFRFSG